MSRKPLPDIAGAAAKKQAPQPARARAGREVAAQERFSARCEAADFLVADVDPFDLTAPDGVGDIVQCVTRHAPAMLDARQLQCLDHDFGVQLLDRSGRTVRPTDMGEAYLRHVRRALDELEVGGRAIRDVKDLSSGVCAARPHICFTPLREGNGDQ